MTWPAFKEENAAASRREISESLRNESYSIDYVLDGRDF